MSIRQALESDIDELFSVRMAVRENVLNNPSLVTNEICKAYITERGRGWVYMTDNRIAGFGIADLEGNSIWALFVLPGYERQGIGRKLHDTMLEWYFTKTGTTLWLTTEPGTRAEKFYRSAGWKDAGYKHGEVKFEMTAEEWRNRAKP